MSNASKSSLILCQYAAQMSNICQRELVIADIDVETK